MGGMEDNFDFHTTFFHPIFPFNVLQQKKEIFMRNFPEKMSQNTQKRTNLGDFSTNSEFTRYYSLQQLSFLDFPQAITHMENLGGGPGVARHVFTTKIAKKLAKNGHFWTFLEKWIFSS